MIRRVHRQISDYERRIAAFPEDSPAHWAPNLRNCLPERGRGKAQEQRERVLTDRVREAPEWQAVQARLLEIGALVRK